MQLNLSTLTLCLYNNRAYGDRTALHSRITATRKFTMVLAGNFPQKEHRFLSWLTEPHGSTYQRQLNMVAVFCP